MDDCFTDTYSVKIIVTTLAEETKSNVGSYEIENVFIYIFDESYNFIKLVSGTDYIPGENYETYVDIEPGIYHCVVWTNNGEVYKTTEPLPGRSSIDDLFLYMECPPDNIITENIPDLHHGMTTDAEVLSGRDNEIKVVIRPNTYTLNFIVEGLTYDNDYLFSVTDNNWQYKFDNDFVEDQEDIEYRRPAKLSDGEIRSSMKVLRLADNREPWMEFSDLTSDICLCEDDLVKMIKTAYDDAGETLDFDVTYEFDIYLKFDAELKVKITINGWDYNYNGIGLGR